MPSAVVEHTCRTEAAFDLHIPNKTLGSWRSSRVLLLVGSSITWRKLSGHYRNHLDCYFLLRCPSDRYQGGWKSLMRTRAREHESALICPERASSACSTWSGGLEQTPNVLSSPNPVLPLILTHIHSKPEGKENCTRKLPHLSVPFVKPLNLV